MSLKKEERLRLIEILEDEILRQQRLHKRRGGANRIEAGFIEELQDLITTLKGNSK